MSYATQADLVTRFSTEELAQLTDRVDGQFIDSAVVDRAIADAEAEINGYLGVRYQLPLASVPAVLGRVACDVARYYLHDDRATESVRKRYEDALRWLRLVAGGEVVLDTASPLVSAPSGVAVSVRAPARVFSADALGDY